MPCLPTVEVPVLDVSCLRIDRFSRKNTTRLMTLIAVVLPMTVSAAVTNYVWDGSVPGNSRWSRGGNWSALDIAPPANNVSGLTNSDITFTGNVKTSPVVDDSYYIRTLNFDSSAASFTLSPRAGDVISIGSGGINNFSINRQSILTTLSVINSQSWNAAAGDLSLLGLVNLDSTNVLTITGGFDTGITNVIQGTGSLEKLGPGDLTLAGLSGNTFSGGVALNAGTIVAAKANALGSGPLTLSGGTLNIGSYNQNVSSFSLLGGTLQATSGTLLSSSAFQIQAGNIYGQLGGASGLMKTTPGVATLTSSNSYSGATAISGGTLLVNNITGSGTGSGNVSISNGGLLAGSGFISGIVTNRFGGIISAGNPVGRLNLDSSIWLGGSSYRWDISDATGTAGTGWDLLNLSGSLTINATTNNKAYIDITSFTLGGIPGLASNFNPTNNYLWTILTASGGISFAPGESELTVLDLIVGNYINPLSGGRFGIFVSTDGRNLNLTFTPFVPVDVPEPNGIALAALTACGLVYGRRLKRNWSPSDR